MSSCRELDLFDLNKTVANMRGDSMTSFSLCSVMWVGSGKGSSGVRGARGWDQADLHANCSSTVCWLGPLTVS